MINDVNHRWIGHVFLLCFVLTGVNQLSNLHQTEENPTKVKSVSFISFKVLILMHNVTMDVDILYMIAKVKGLSHLPAVLPIQTVPLTSVPETKDLLFALR